MDFGFTREIEDRLLAPIRMEWLAVAKVVSGVAQGLIAALFLLPVARLIMGPIDGLTVAHVGLVLLLTVLGAAAFSTFGLWLGTAISPQQIGLMFGVIVTPLIFFGCAYYPWQGLSVLPVLKYLVLINPLVYVAEGMRGAITPSLPHMPVPRGHRGAPRDHRRVLVPGDADLPRARAELTRRRYAAASPPAARSAPTRRSRRSR